MFSEKHSYTHILSILSRTVSIYHSGKRCQFGFFGVCWEILLEWEGLRFLVMDKSRENGLFIVVFRLALQFTLALTILSLKANTKRIFGGAK
ncbi:hypothetical protein FZ027_08550 [Listeria monocytogenes]|uniref:Transmembrane protein n=1 Tax=Listeria monocytogenes TaxID=1639 RepID=A0AB74N8R4_LISMN|nr:hypothetical protein FZW98_13395 [Listeria monocytogenes]TYU51634.1 hypothetical protein FZ027_08550 [Listeria monocytogenes]